jgi:hypothetical protein
VINLQATPCSLGDSAAHVDFDRKCVTLYSGLQLPLVAVWDEEGQQVDEACLDLHNEIVVIYGPRDGTLYGHPMRRGDRDTMQ